MYGTDPGYEECRNRASDLVDITVKVNVFEYFVYELYIGL